MLGRDLLLFFEFLLYELLGRDVFVYATRYVEFHLSGLSGRDLLGYNRGHFRFYVYELLGREVFDYSTRYFKFHLYELPGPFNLPDKE